MEPECSLPHSQVSATCPILSQFDPVHTPTSNWRSILILSSHLAPVKFVSHKVSISSVTHTEMGHTNHKIRVFAGSRAALDPS